MNVSLQKLFLGLLFVLAIPLAGWSQDIPLETFRNTPVNYDFSSPSLKPTILSPQPANGKAIKTDLGQGKWRITYQPNAGFTGTDRVQFTVGTGTSWEIRRLVITVLPSLVDARPDLVVTHQNVAVDIDALVNDVSSTGNLVLKSILLVNNGQATIVDGQQVITFTPAADFRGIAQLNYVVCDEFNACDQGTVSINVLGTAADGPDTTRIFTKKNKPQTVLIPREFRLTSPPAHGDYDPDAELPTYTPEPGYVGKDYFELAEGDMVKVVEVTVLDVIDNVFAFDDNVYTTPLESVEFNVLENDFYGLNSGCLEVGQPEYGRLESGGENGQLTYVPADGFQGLDRFTYSVNAPGCQSRAESATVFVSVSNFEPAYSKFKMVTPKRTPLIIGYNVPINNFGFQITDQAELGVARFLRGQVDTTIYGQRIQGSNIIVYIPGDQINSGTDEFEIVYCVAKNETCQVSKVVKIEVDILDIGDGSAPMCFDDCIWAGDTNFDGIVNVEDLLPVGIFMGKVGIPRDGVNLDMWYGQYGDNWGEKGNGIIYGDIKHVDTNGDSLITALDTTAISRFYGNTHSLASSRVPNFKHNIELQGDFYVRPGDLIELDMVLGQTQLPALNVYGFTFPFEYNTDIFDPQSVEVAYSSSSWLAYGSPVLYMSHNNTSGLMESAITRTNGISISGFGKIGKVRIVVEDDINGFRPGDEEVTVELGGGVGAVVDAAGQSFGARITPVTIHIDLTGKDQTELDNPVVAEHLLKVFPNPTGDFLNVHLNGGHEFQRVIVHNLAGQQVMDSGALQTRSKRLNVSQFGNGIYFLSVQAARGVIREKFEVIR